jgi:serine/threonine protein kinase
MATAQPTLVPETCDRFDAPDTIEADSTTARSQNIPLPTVVGDWRVCRRVGQGSTANVFLVRCSRYLAVMKVERADATRSARTCIHREARWLRKNGGAGRPVLLDEGQLQDGRAWFVMSLAPGQTLSDWWRTEGRHDPVEAIRIIARTARIMGATHRSGWVHRDLKPGNIAVGPDGEVTVLDWGLVHRDHPHATHTARVAGTPGFIPPEMFQARRPEYSAQLDTYALGCCLLVLLSKKQMWPHELKVSGIHRIVEDAGLTGIAARTLERILARAISPSPSQRWINGDALAAELECWDRCMAPAPQHTAWTGEPAMYRTPA